MEKLYYERKMTAAALIFSLVLVFMTAFIFLSGQIGKGQAGSGEKVLSGSFGEIREIVCTADEDLVLRRTGEGWECVNDSIPVDSGRIDDLCVLLQSMESVRILDNASEYYDMFGFSSPTCTVIAKSDTDEISLRIGMYNSGTDTFYLVDESQPDKVYLVRDKYVSPFLLGRADLVPGIEHVLPSASEISEITVSSSAGCYSLKRAETLSKPLYSPAYKWAVDGMYSKPSPGYDSRVSAFVDTILALGKCERIAYSGLGSVMDANGLSADMHLTLTYQVENGLRTAEIVFSAPAMDGSICFTDGGGTLLYKMDADEYSAFARFLEPSYMMAKQLCLFDPDAIESLFVYGSSVSTQLYISHADEEIYMLADGKEADADKAVALLDGVRALSCDGYMPSGSLVMPEHIADTLEIIIAAHGCETKMTLEMYDYNFYIAKIDAVDSALISKIKVSELKRLAASLGE